jgi:hypothetical protein
MYSGGKKATLGSDLERPETHGSRQRESLIRFPFFFAYISLKIFAYTIFFAYTCISRSNHLLQMTMPRKERKVPVSVRLYKSDILKICNLWQLQHPEWTELPSNVLLVQWYIGFILYHSNIKV